MRKTAFEEFIAQGSQGRSNIWTWLAAFWLGLMFWFFGQIIIGIPLSKVEAISNPESLDTLMANGQNPENLQQILGLMAILFLGTVIAVVSFLNGNGFGDKPKKPAMVIAGLAALVSFLALIGVIALGQSPEEMKLLNEWVANSPIVYALMLAMFPPLAIGLWVGVKYIQKRPILSLHTAHKHFRWKRMVFAALLVFAIAGIFTAFGHFSGLNKVEIVFDANRFFKYLPITLLFIPLQSATEEIALRGYLNQGLGQYIKSPWIVFIITSAGFAALHLGNPEVAETLKQHSIFTAMGGYFAFGMFASLMTLIDGGLESAIGMHAANNIFAAAIVGYDNSALPTPTIFNIGLDSKLDTIGVIIMLSIVCLILYLTRRPLEPADTLASEFS